MLRSKCEQPSASQKNKTEPNRTEYVSPEYIKFQFLPSFIHILNPNNATSYLVLLP